MFGREGSDSDPCILGSGVHNVKHKRWFKSWDKKAIPNSHKLEWKSPFRFVTYYFVKHGV